MAFEIKMPQLGESVTEGTIGRWLVQPGTTVQKYQPIAEVITDKVNAEIPAPADGTMQALLVAEGTTVKVGTPIATMATAVAAQNGGVPVAAPGLVAEAAAGPGAGAGGKVGVPQAGTPAGGPLGGGTGPVTGSPAAAGARPEAAPMSGGVERGGGRFSPAVMRLAQEHGVELSRVTGTGMGGRITRRDVENYIAARPQGAGAEPAPAPAAAAATTAGMLRVQPPQEIARVEPADPAPSGAPTPATALSPAMPAELAQGDQVIPVSPVRRRIAERMVLSKTEAPHAWTMVRADVTGLVRLRDSLKEEFKRREGVDLTFMPFFIKAVTDSLREFPMLNSQWQGETIVLKRDINISVAVATADALQVPVVKNTDRLSITGLAHALAGLVSRARQGKLTLDDVSGGTFTLNNTGAFGSFLSAPIINYPQAAIMTVEAINRELVVQDNDAIAIRHMVNLCLSLDHRVLDGLVCLRFLRAVQQRVESFAAGTVDLY